MAATAAAVPDLHACAEGADAANTLVTLPRGSPLDGDAGCLSVVSYNLLAPLYVRPIDNRTGEVQSFAAYAWSTDEVSSTHTTLVLRLCDSRTDTRNGARHTTWSADSRLMISQLQ